MARPRAITMALVEAQIPAYWCGDVHQFAGQGGQLVVLLRWETIGQAKMQPLLRAQWRLAGRRGRQAHKLGYQPAQPWAAQEQAVEILAQHDPVDSEQWGWLRGARPAQRYFQRFTVTTDGCCFVVK